MKKFINYADYNFNVERLKNLASRIYPDQSSAETERIATEIAKYLESLGAKLLIKAIIMHTVVLNNSVVKNTFGSQVTWKYKKNEYTEINGNVYIALHKASCRLMQDL